MIVGTPFSTSNSFSFRQFASPLIASGNTVTIEFESDDQFGDTEEFSIYVIAARDSSKFWTMQCFRFASRELPWLRLSSSIIACYLMGDKGSYNERMLLCQKKLCCFENG